MSRFTDDYPFFGAPSKNPPATLNMLLNRLGVDFGSLDEQRDAVSNWLKEHTPGPRLAAEVEQRLMVTVIR